MRDLFLLVAFVVLVAGCGQDDGTTKSDAGNFLDAQTEAMEKAKGVEQMVLDTAAKQREAIDKQSQ